MLSAKWRPFCLGLNVLMQKRCISSAKAMDMHIYVLPRGLFRLGTGQILVNTVYNVNPHRTGDKTKISTTVCVYRTWQ